MLTKPNDLTLFKHYAQWHHHIYVIQVKDAWIVRLKRRGKLINDYRFSDYKTALRVADLIVNSCGWDDRKVSIRMVK